MPVRGKDKGRVVDLNDPGVAARYRLNDDMKMLDLRGGKYKKLLKEKGFAIDHIDIVEDKTLILALCV